MPEQQEKQTQSDKKAQLKDRFASLLGGSDALPSTPPRAGAKLARKAAAQPTRQRKSVSKPARVVEPMPLKQDAADLARPKRLMVPLSTDEDHVLKQLRLADGIAAAARVRALLQLYRTDDRVKKKTDEVARFMR